jgi:hypothetical protein
MTISVALKVGDGIVLGADSATTMIAGQAVANVYFNAEKILNLAKGFPLGAVTFGVGLLRGRSITGLAKDLRERLSGSDPDWFLVPDQYTVEQAAERLRRFFYEELYLSQFPKTPPAFPPGEYPTMGFYVAGYSANESLAEIWVLTIDANGDCPNPRQKLAANAGGGAIWGGQPEALNRLMLGWSTEVYQGLVASKIAPNRALSFLNGLNVARLATDAMPIQDAIDLAKYMIDVTAGYVRFAPGAPVVHHPVDIATITLYEGFRWVQRKHYYPAALNPEPHDRHRHPLPPEIP